MNTYNYLKIFENLGYGLIETEILYHKNKPYDFKILEMNKNVKNIIKDIMKNNPDLELKEFFKYSFIKEINMKDFFEGYIRNIDKLNNKPINVYNKKLDAYYEFVAYLKNRKCLFVIRDITKEQKKDILIYKLQKRLNISLDIGRIGWWELNIKTGYIEFHKNKAELLDYTIEEFPKHMYDIMKLIHPDDYEHTMNAMKKHLNGEDEFYHTEYRIRTKNGYYKWFYDQGQIIERDKDHSPLNLIGVVMDITERKNTELKLKELADFDPLTNCYNRRMGLILLEEKLKYSKRYQKKCVICFIDQDNLKYINDNYGHDIGDDSLKLLAKTIKSEIRDSDILCRIGGDEFFIIFPDCVKNSALSVINRIKNKLKDINKNLDFYIDFSFGFFEYNDFDSIDIDEFIKKADEDMYSMKKLKKISK